MTEELHITENHDAISLLEAIASEQQIKVTVALNSCKYATVASQIPACLSQ